jgi:gamma-glutamylcyclotransferase (GGCT)/AIG2-like uncharacterized protein YtfP
MHLFAYGTLIFPEVWRRVVGPLCVSEPAALARYEAFYARGGTYPVIVQGAAGDLVHGVVYFDLDANDFSKLDAYESTLYERQSVDVRLSSGESLSCQAYVLPESRRRFATDRPWRRDYFERYELEGYLRRLH